MKRLTLAIAMCAVLAVAGCGGSGDSSGESAAAAAEEPPALIGKPTVTVPDGPPPKQLQIEELQKGTGAPVERGDYVTVQYVGVDYGTGREFASSWGGKPLRFTVGAGKEIPGLEKGMEGMKPGGRRELIVPPNLAFGKVGSPPSIGPDETLIYAVDLFEASTPPRNSH